MRSMLPAILAVLLLASGCAGSRDTLSGLYEAPSDGPTAVLDLRDDGSASFRFNTNWEALHPEPGLAQMLAKSLMYAASIENGKWREEGGKILVEGLRPMDPTEDDPTMLELFKQPVELEFSRQSNGDLIWEDSMHKGVSRLTKR